MNNASSSKLASANESSYINVLNGNEWRNMLMAQWLMIMANKKRSVINGENNGNEISA